ncbi:MAG: hydroxymethylbilane synthase [Deltaproteobacteria bacterium]|nr:hydroxymethylbilane synthase [Deltaproteobacteria bacterium]
MKLATDSDDLAPPSLLRIGTRGSKLALWQAHWVRDRLLELGVAEVTLEIIKTQGDRIQDVALSEVGGKGLFVKELEEALLDGRVDLAVHSMKDMPSELPAGLTLAAVPVRADPRDAWVLPQPADSVADPVASLPLLDRATILALPHAATIGTSSLRRAAQLLVLRPDLTIIPLRGNVDTRLRKLDAGEGGVSAIILACAGLSRLGLGHRISAAIPEELMRPAVGQGALAIQTRQDDPRVRSVVDRMDDPDTRATTTAERAFLARLEGNCQVPIAAHATLDGDTLTLDALLADPSGKTLVTDHRRGPRAQAAALGLAAAEALLDNGGKDLMAARGS